MSAYSGVDFDGSQLYSESKAKQEQKSAAVSGAALGLILLIGVGVLLAARFWLPDTGSSRASSGNDFSSPVEAIASRAPAAANGFADWLQRKLPGERPLKLDWRAKAGFKGWSEDFGDRKWRVSNGFALPGSLRLWTPTLGKQDYDLTFTGIINKSALNVAFRADGERYYATKLRLNRPGKLSGASIVRMVVSGGKTIGETELPLPVILRADHPYKVTLTAQGDSFATYLDGHLVDEWHDTRFRKGGVGFFSETGESSGISSVSFRERKGLFSNIFATLFYLPPGFTF